MDVRERVLEHRLTLDAEARATTWLGAILRHPAAASAVDEALFTITRNPDGNASVTVMSRKC